MRVRVAKPATVAAVTIVALVFAGGAALGATALVAKAPTFARACLGSTGSLVLSSGSTCAKGLRAIDLPLSTAKGARGATGPQGEPGVQGPLGPRRVLLRLRWHQCDGGDLLLDERGPCLL